MKRIARVFMVLLASAMVLMSCAPEVDSNGNGQVKVLIQETAARGIAAVDMDTSYYKVEAVNAVKNQTVTKTVRADEKEVLLSVATGETVVKVTAYNSSDLAIGSGESAPVNVTHNGITPCKVVVSEHEGNGNLVFNVKTTINDTLTAKIFKASQNIMTDTPVASVALTESSDVFTGTATLEKGYYQFVIASSTGTLTTPEAVRIVAGYDARCNIDILDNGRLNLTIENTITKTPTVNIKGLCSYYLPGDAYNLTAEVTGMTKPTYRWYFDNILVTDNFDGVTPYEGNTLAGNLPTEANLASWGISYGKHVITCIAIEGDTVWSAKAESILYSKADKPREIAIPEGTLELAVIGDVLVPDGLRVDCLLDGTSLEVLGSNHTNEVRRVHAGNLSCNISGAEGYTYYLEQMQDQERTVIFIVIDKQIENPGYLHLTFNQKFVLDDGVSRGIYVAAQNTRFPSDNYDYEDKGHISINNRIKERTIKVEPDTYSRAWHSGYDASHAFWGELNPRIFSVAAGSTVDVEITSQPFAHVNATFPASAEGREVTIYDGYGNEVDWDRIPVKDGKAVFYSSSMYDEKYTAVADSNGPMKMYETEVLRFSEGEIDVVFTEKEIPTVNTGIQVGKNETVIYNFDFKSIFNDELKVFASTVSGSEIYWWRQEDQYCTFPEDGELKLHPLFAGKCIFTVTERKDQINGHRVIDIVVDLPESERVPVKLNYEFTYLQSEHYNMYPGVSMNPVNRRYEGYMISLRDGKTSINMLPGNYESSGCSIWSRGNNWTEEINVKEKSFTIDPLKENALTLIAVPRRNRR